jgi:hypothetical protein
MCSTGPAQWLRVGERIRAHVEPHGDGDTDSRTAADRTVRSGPTGSIGTRISIAAQSSENGRPCALPPVCPLGRYLDSEPLETFVQPMLGEGRS